ncbi:hypothetical protein [Pseudomonas citronellolis]|uniref:hypothetical protein n=1 Tax=Pseudomonas citronellolis TaxID=53408 RepID=UPI0023E3578F|nr:hypothetical protein [Pseudomonas citronellolis]MDF3934345.1 hypothetical protein [Pseudomonas citronellolis]
MSGKLPVLRFLIKSYFVCTGAIFVAMVLGVYVSSVMEGVNIDFEGVIFDAAIDSLKGGAVMTFAAAVMLKNYWSRSRK